VKTLSLFFMLLCLSGCRSFFPALLPSSNSTEELESAYYQTQIAFPARGAAPAEKQALPAQAPVEVARAIAQGRSALLRLQNPDGSWGSHEQMGVTALAVLSLMEAETESVDAGLEYLLNHLDEQGLVQPFLHTSGPYEQVLTVMAFLAAVERGFLSVGEERIQKALSVAVERQGRRGGWSYGYNFKSRDNSSLSLLHAQTILSGWKLGLLSADECASRFAGIIDQVLRLQNGKGRVGYQMRGVGGLRPMVEAASILNAVSLTRTRPLLSAAYGAQEEVSQGGGLGGWPLFSAWRISETLPCVSSEVWRQFVVGASPEILKQQAENGSWAGPGKESRYGPAYATALSVLILISPEPVPVQRPVPPFVWRLRWNGTEGLLLATLPSEQWESRLYPDEFLLQLSVYSSVLREPYEWNWIHFVAGFKEGRETDVARFQRLHQTAKSLNWFAKNGGLPSQNRTVEYIVENIDPETIISIPSPADITTFLMAMDSLSFKQITRELRRVQPDARHTLHMYYRANDIERFKVGLAEFQESYPATWSTIGPYLNQVNRKTAERLKAQLQSGTPTLLQASAWRLFGPGGLLEALENAGIHASQNSLFSKLGRLDVDTSFTGQEVEVEGKAEQPSKKK